MQVCAKVERGTARMLRYLTALPLPRRRVSAFSSLMMCKSKVSGPSKQISPRFVSLEDDEGGTSSFRFRLVSYNILAQVYVKSSYFPHSPSSCLKWKARSQAVLSALLGLNADFLCIQELDEYDSFYKRNMESNGYSSIYIQRNGQKRDGCGIFYKLSCAELLLVENIYYNDLVNSLDMEAKGASEEDSPGKDKHNVRGDPNDPRIRLKRDCVGLLAAFKLNDPSHHLVVVANTHIYWDPEWVDVKLAQVKYLLLRLSKFEKDISEKYGCTPSVIVAGDFNSTPGDEVYDYIVSPKSSMDNPGIQLCSAYGSNRGEPPFTNCTPDFTGTLDYIFLSDTGFSKPVGILQVPGPESPDIIGGLPNHHHPSDHLPIGVEFEVCARPIQPSKSKLSEASADDISKLNIDEDPQNT